MDADARVPSPPSDVDVRTVDDIDTLLAILGLPAGTKPVAVAGHYIERRRQLLAADPDYRRPEVVLLDDAFSRLRHITELDAYERAVRTASAHQDQSRRELKAKLAEELAARARSRESATRAGWGASWPLAEIQALEAVGLVPAVVARLREDGWRLPEIKALAASRTVLTGDLLPTSPAEAHRRAGRHLDDAVEGVAGVLCPLHTGAVLAVRQGDGEHTTVNPTPNGFVLRRYRRSGEDDEWRRDGEPAAVDAGTWRDLIGTCPDLFDVSDDSDREYLTDTAVIPTPELLLALRGPSRPHSQPSPGRRLPDWKRRWAVWAKLGLAAARVVVNGRRLATYAAGDGRQVLVLPQVVTSLTEDVPGERTPWETVDLLPLGRELASHTWLKDNGDVWHGVVREVGAGLLCSEAWTGDGRHGDTLLAVPDPTAVPTVLEIWRRTAPGHGRVRPGASGDMTLRAEEPSDDAPVVATHTWDGLDEGIFWGALHRAATGDLVSEIWHVERRLRRFSFLGVPAPADLPEIVRRWWESDPRPGRDRPLTFGP